jgi:hypothetical protein
MPQGDLMVRRLHIVIVMCALMSGLHVLNAHNALAWKGGFQVFNGPGLAGRAYKAGELIVKFTEGASQSDQERIHTRNGSEALKKYNRLGIHRVKVPEGIALEQAAMEYRSDPAVEYVEPNYVVTTLAIPDDSSLELLWSLAQIIHE